MKVDAKKEADSIRRAANLTGGGPPPIPTSVSTSAAISVLGDSINPIENIDDPPSPFNNDHTQEPDLSTSSCYLLPASKEQQIGICNISLPSDDTSDNRQMETLNPTRKRKRLDASIQEAQLQLIKEAIKTEKNKQELNRLERWKIRQELISKGYGLPPDNFV